MAHVLSSCMCMLIVWLLCLSLSSYMHIVRASTSSPDHQYVSFSLTHRDAKSSPLKSAEADPADLPSDMPMRSFVAAGRALRGRVNMQKKLLNEAGKPFIGKISYRGGDTVGDFYLTVSVGTPSQKLIFLLDTGSEFTWTQCSPCLNCTRTTEPRFTYSRSSSFLPIGCNSHLCVNSVLLTCLSSTGCNISSAGPAPCLFQVSYGDNSVDAGFFSVDSFNLGPTLSKPFVFGCATVVLDTVPAPSSGLMGLDAAPFSFTSQLFAGNPHMPRKFAYCLPDRFKSLNEPGRIEFGNYKPPAKVRYTPLAPPYGPLGSIYYFVKLEGISVGETLIKVEGVKAGGGTIFDSGSAVTSLVKPVYDEMVREMKRQTAHLRPFNVTADDGSSDFCYKAPLHAKKPPKVPTISMHFAGGAELELGPGSILAAQESDNKSILFCLAFVSITDTAELNIIGNYQQQNYWVEHNLETSSLGLAKAMCANYK